MSEDADQRLATAVRAGDDTAVARALADGADPTTPATRRSILAEAVSATRRRARPGALTILRLLLEAGATAHPGEEPALITAVMSPVAPAVLRLLLAHGADPGARRSDGAPAIVVAARLGDHAAVDTLAAAGADVQAGDRQGRTALMHAVERNEQRVIAVLLTAGADIGTVSADGMTALRLARGWHRQNIQFMLGENHAGLDDVPITRTVVRFVPDSARLTGDPRMLHLLASVVDIALDDLGDDEWQARTGYDATVARAAARRLRHEITPAPRASWHELRVTADELGAIRSALVELAYGTTRETPDDTSRIEIVDMLSDLDRQLGR